MSVPTPPQIRPRPKATDGVLEFWWAPPLSDGGSPVTGYTIEIPGVYVDTVGAAIGYYRITGLTNGTPYTAQIYATNDNGNSELAYFRTVQPGNPPGVPTSQSITRNSAGNATIQWSAPGSDGGATIGWNVVTCFPLDSAAPKVVGTTFGNGTSLTFPDLSANTTYNVVVRARNDPAYSSKAVFLPPLTFGTVPSDISGLRIWLDAADVSSQFSDASGIIASSLETSSIILWKDKSGLNHDVSGVIPARRLVGGVKGARYPCIQFNNGIAFQSGTFTVSNTNSLTMFIVTEIPTLGTSETLFNWNGVNGLGVEYDISGSQFLLKADTNIGFAAITNTFIGTIYADNSTTTASILTSSGTTTVSQSRESLSSFNDSSPLVIGTDSVDIRISELLIWDRVLDITERSQISGYLKKKWGFPVELVYLVAADLTGGDTTWIDRSGNGFNATLENGTSAKNGANAVILDGSTNWTFADIGTQANFSLLAWFKRTGSSDPASCIVTQNFSGTIHMALISNFLDSDDTQFQGGFYDGTSWRTGTPQTFTANTWTQMTITWDGALLKTYIGGALVDTADHTGTTASSSGQPYRIGRRPDSAEYVTGEVGEVRIDGVALSASQVSAYYAATSSIYS